MRASFHSTPDNVVYRGKITPPVLLNYPFCLWKPIFFYPTATPCIKHWWLRLMYRKRNLFFRSQCVSSDRFCLHSERQESKSRCERSKENGFEDWNPQRLWDWIFDWKIAITFLELLRTAGMTLLSEIWDLREVSKLRRVCILFSCLLLPKGYK